MVEGQALSNGRVGGGCSRRRRVRGEVGVVQRPRTCKNLAEMGLERCIHARLLKVFMGLHRIPICAELGAGGVVVAANKHTHENGQDTWILDTATPIETLIAILLGDCVSGRLPDCTGRGLGIFEVGGRVDRKVCDLCSWRHSLRLQVLGSVTS